MEIIRKKGLLLNLILGAFVFLLLFRLITLLAPSQFNIDNGGPVFAYAFNVFVFIAISLGVIAIFFWKRVGIYAVVAAKVLMILFDVIYFPKQLTLFGHITNAIPYCLLALAVYLKRNDFR